MRALSRTARLCAVLLSGALAAGAVACAEAGPDPLAPDTPSTSRAPATDAELSAREAQGRGRSALIW